MHTSTQQLAAAFMAFGLVSAAPSYSHGRTCNKTSSVAKPARVESKIKNVQVGPRPFWLIDNMDEGPLKEKLESCKENTLHTTSFSISHRGAPLMFPEHSKEGYAAAARMGAGKLDSRIRERRQSRTSN
jgi:glycerophosphoryl diester phosphodiesterase